MRFNFLVILLSIIVFSFGIGVAVYFIIEALHPRKKISFRCDQLRWGCCPDNLTPKYDQMGTNCTLSS